uniref:Uncharacterized protein n=1 Tax=Nelumbo nucifera TaxID=4432 RepID=A0A822XLZ7_NELNU|nr:TPA_asm: hypothetical protein HUJ06_021552 [Nelumbo nucifera]
MISYAKPSGNPVLSTIQAIQRPPSKPPLLRSNSINNIHHQNPRINSSPINTNNKSIKPQTHLLKPIIITPNQIPLGKSGTNDRSTKSPQVGRQQVLGLCGFGYWVQGFRCFPWLAMNFHMAHTLKLHPSTLQLVQNSANLPMVAKPLYGVLSDALYIGGAHRIPYVSIGVFLQILSWGALALIPLAGEALPTLMVCILLSNLGASVTEVAKDALVAEYSQKHGVSGLQSYAFKALAAGGILGNLIGGFFLLKTQQTKTMFLLFAALLSLQLAISLTTREGSLNLPQPSDHHFIRNTLSENLRKQLSSLVTAISEECISGPLTWTVASIAAVPILSGSIFCYQTQFLRLDPSIIGMSKVIGQLMLLFATLFYDRYWKRIPMRKLIGMVQLIYASSLLLDLVLIKQINLRLGIPNEAYVLCFSGLAEMVAQFKLLPFSILFANLCPPGCEGALTSFLASALCLSSIISGFLGVGLASLIGVTSGDYSRLPLGISLQFLAALVPLGWLSRLPMSQPISKERKRSVSKKGRKGRRVGRMAFGYVYAYRRQRESEADR